MGLRASLAIGAMLAGTAVACGAFGAHGLQARLSPSALATWQTAVDYQFIHAVGLLLLGALDERLKAPWSAAAALSFIVGTLLFCGSLYALALGGPRLLGALAPVGGLAFISGWLALALAALLPRR